MKLRLTAALLVVLSVMVIAPAAAAAQTNATATPTATASSTATNATATESAGPITRIDGDAVVVDAEHENGSMVLTIQSDVFKSATVSGTVGGEDAGGGSFAIKGVTLYEGQTTVRISAPMVDDVATATIVTSSCQEAGRCGYVQIGDNDGGGSILTGGSTLGWLGGAFTALACALAAVWLLTRGGDDAPEEV